MSTLQVANIHFESTANNRMHLVGSNIAIAVAGSNTLTMNSTSIVAVPNSFTLGSSTIAANGYTFLPNGLKMNWGLVAAANTAAGTTATFVSPFTTACHMVQVSVRDTARTVPPLVISANTTAANISCGLATTSGLNVYFMAIGV